MDLKKALLCAALVLAFVACGEDYNYGEYCKYYEYYEYAKANAIDICPIWARVQALLIEDLDFLESAMRADLPALAGPVRRRLGIDIFNQLGFLRQGVLRDSPPFRTDATSFARMRFDAEVWLHSKLQDMNAEQLGLLHFITDNLSHELDFYGFRAGFGFAPFRIAHQDTPRFSNLTSDILTPDKVAYLNVRQGWRYFYYDRSYLISFLHEIQHFDHLIIDFRGHMGGGRYHTLFAILHPLISEPVYTYYYHLFTSGGHASWLFENDFLFWGQGAAHSFEIFNAQEFVADRGMVYFNQEDLRHLEYAIITTFRLEPLEESPAFNGRIWFLINERTGSEGDLGSLQFKTSGIATLVGDPTRGIAATERTWVQLPNTLIWVTYDTGYPVDGLGRSLVETGIQPHYRSRAGMDALQTVLAMIEEGE